MVRILFALCAVTLALSCEAAAGPALRKGVNLSNWFQFGGDKPVSKDDLSRIRAAGFDHVRIPFDPEFLGWKQDGGPELPKIAALRRGVEQALESGLDVVLDMHLDERRLQTIEGNRSAEKALAQLWSTVAQKFSDLPSERLAFELLNEPQYYEWSIYRWPDVQAQLFKSVRAIAPRHLILATGRKGGSAEGLAELAPIADGNVAYVFHFYLPYIYTHQGADWLQNNLGTAASFVKGLPYPPQKFSASGSLLPPSDSRRRQAERELADYRGKRWDSATMQTLMQPAINWAQRNHVRVICNEFGVLRAFAPPESRYEWIHDVREALEKNGFGWTVWDFADTFAITKSLAGGASQNRREFEPAAIKALNLNRQDQ